MDDILSGVVPHRCNPCYGCFERLALSRPRRGLVVRIIASRSLDPQTVNRT